MELSSGEASKTFLFNLHEDFAFGDQEKSIVIKFIGWTLRSQTLSVRGVIFLNLTSILSFSSLLLGSIIGFSPTKCTFIHANVLLVARQEFRIRLGKSLIQQES